MDVKTLLIYYCQAEHRLNAEFSGEIRKDDKKLLTRIKQYAKDLNIQVNDNELFEEWELELMQEED